MLAEQFRPILCLQSVLLLIDLLINTFCDFLKAPIISKLVLFVIQDVVTVSCIIIIFLMFFNTYVFRAGLLNILFAHFRMPLTIASCYLCLSISLHVWSLKSLWSDPYKYIWTKGYLTLHILQRLCSVFYYYTYKRTALRIADPRFYQDGKWLREELAKR